MALALKITFPGAFYHVTPSGNECKADFKSKTCEEFFFNKDGKK